MNTPVQAFVIPDPFEGRPPFRIRDPRTEPAVGDQLLIYGATVTIVGVSLSLRNDDDSFVSYTTLADGGRVPATLHCTMKLRTFVGQFQSATVQRVAEYFP